MPLPMPVAVPVGLLGFRVGRWCGGHACQDDLLSRIMRPGVRAHDELAGAQGFPEQVEGDHLVAAEVLRHLGDPTRLHLLWLLAEGPRDVNGLTAAVDASRSSVSQRLAGSGMPVWFGRAETAGTCTTA